MEPSARERRLWLGVVLAAAVLYLGFGLHAARVETPTVDEFAHLPAGCSYWKTGDFGLYAKNPPLLKLWMSLPVVADGGVTVPRVDGPKSGWGPWVYGTAFMNANRARYFGLFFRARFMVILLGLATAGLLFLWARELYSVPTAAILSSLFLLSPTVLAHAHLATIDMGCALTMLLAAFAVRRSCREPGWKPALMAGGAFGLALAVKYTAALLLPAVVVLYVRYRIVPAGLRAARRAARRGEPRSGLRKAPRPEQRTEPTESRKAPAAPPTAPAEPRASRRWGALGRDAGVVLVTALFVVNVSMAFRGSFRPLGRFAFASAFLKGVQHRFPGGLPVPLPADYVAGFDAQKLDTEAGEFGSYLLGRWSQGGWWYYNLFALLVKEPETILLLLVGAPWFWRKRSGRREGGWFLLTPALSLFAFLSLFNRLNIGIRYLLPVLPFLYLLIGPVVEAARAWRPAWRRWAVLGVPLGYAVATAIAVHPGYLGYFNPLSGGPARGSRLLLDSNIDWGQDLYRVAGWAKSLPAGETPGLLYFGHVDPAIYGITYEPVPPQPVKGLLAVSVNFLRGYPYLVSLPGGKFAMVNAEHLQWLRGKTPVKRLGSIWVFDTR